MIAMEPTQGFSFPRSGHAVAFHLAKRYFGDALIYCDTNNTRFCGCGSVPCINPARTFAKNHDFGLRRSPGVPILAQERYLVQYRNPVHSICSNFFLYLKKHPEEDSLAGWQKFAYRDIYYWNHFIDKWVIDFPVQGNQPLNCIYEELIAKPRETSRVILDYMSAEPLDEALFEHVMKGLNISARNALEEFKYFDRGFFRELEEAAAQRLAQLALPAWDD